MTRLAAAFRFSGRLAGSCSMALLMLAACYAVALAVAG